MHERLEQVLHVIPGRVTTKTGMCAWNICALPMILQAVVKHKWIILGGDVLTLEGDFAYANWCYDPDPHKSIDSNVHASVESCSRYISDFCQKNGNDYLVDVVISDDYVG